MNAVARRHQQWNPTWSNSFFWSEFWGCQDGHPHSEVGTQFSWIRSDYSDFLWLCKLLVAFLSNTVMDADHKNLSMRPGRSRAESRMSILFVAMITWRWWLEATMMLGILNSPICKTLPWCSLWPQSHPAGWATLTLSFEPGIENNNIVKDWSHKEPDLTVPSTPGLNSSGADGVDLVHEDDGGRMLSSHHEQLSHHATALA